MGRLSIDYAFLPYSCMRALKYSGKLIFFKLDDRSFFSNLMKKMNLDREDEYDDLDQDYDFEDEYEEEEEAAPKRSSFFARREEEESSEPKIRLFGKSKEKAEPKSASMQVVMMKPSSLGDAINVSDYLLDGTSVLLNMEGLHTEIAQRIIDIVSGTVYAIGGDIKKISTYIFIAGPEDVELSGDFAGSVFSSNAEYNGIHLNM